jgi:hypothetical protein
MVVVRRRCNWFERDALCVDALKSQPAPDERVFRLWRNFADRKRFAESPRPAHWTTLRRIQPAGRLRPPMTRPLAALRRRDGGNSCIDRVLKFNALDHINAAEMGGDSLHQPIGPHGNLLVGIVLTDDGESRRVVLRARYLFGPVDRRLDRFDLSVTGWDRNARFPCLRKAPAEVRRFTEKADRAATDR